MLDQAESGYTSKIIPQPAAGQEALLPRGIFSSRNIFYLKIKCSRGLVKVFTDPSAVIYLLDDRGQVVESQDRRSPSQVTKLVHIVSRNNVSSLSLPLFLLTDTSQDSEGASQLAL